MAHYTITYTCGHKGQVALFGPEKDRQNKIAWLSSHRDCPDCQAKARAAANTAAAEANQQAGLPALVGSEKQIAWAEAIRAALIVKADEFFAQLRAVDSPRADKIRAAFVAQASAAYWIDARDTIDVRQLVRPFIVAQPK